MKQVESIEDFLKRGGKIQKCETPEYKQGKFTRYRMKDLNMNQILKKEREKGKV